MPYDDSWVRTSDAANIKKVSWSTEGRQPYLFLLEKITEKNDVNFEFIERNVRFDDKSLSFDNLRKRKADGSFSNSYVLSPDSDDCSKKVRLNDMQEIPVNEGRRMHEYLISRGNIYLLTRHHRQTQTQLV